MTTDRRMEAEQHIASAEVERGAIPNPKRGRGGCRPARRFELFVEAWGNDGGNITIDLEETVKCGWCASESSIGDLYDPTPDSSFVDTSPLPSSTGRGARSISGLCSAADKNSAPAGELGRLVL
jgi:hypothetical protein